MHVNKLLCVRNIYNIIQQYFINWPVRSAYIKMCCSESREVNEPESDPGLLKNNGQSRSLLDSAFFWGPAGSRHVPRPLTLSSCGVV